MKIMNYKIHPNKMVCTAVSCNLKDHTKDKQEAMSYLKEYMNRQQILVKFMLLLL